MNKITVDRALIEQAVELLDKGVCDFWSQYDDKAEGIIQELRAGLAEPAVEPFGYYFQDDPAKFAMPGAGFHLGSTPPNDASAYTPLYTSPPPPAEHGCKFPMCQTEEYQQMLEAQVARELIGVPLLSDEEIADCIRHLYQDETALRMSMEISIDEFRAIEQLVRRKAGL